MLSSTATDQHGREVVGVVDDPARTPTDVAQQFYELGYHRAAIHDHNGHTFGAGVTGHADGRRHRWTC